MQTFANNQYCLKHIQLPKNEYAIVMSAINFDSNIQKTKDWLCVIDVRNHQYSFEFSSFNEYNKKGAGTRLQSKFIRKIG